MLEPKVHFLPGIIMEFKATKNDAGLSASADEALKQIEDKHYDTDMKDRGIREIVKYGIALCREKRGDCDRLKFQSRCIQGQLNENNIPQYIKIQLICCGIFNILCEIYCGAC